MSMNNRVSTIDPTVAITTPAAVQSAPQVRLPMTASVDIHASPARPPRTAPRRDKGPHSISYCGHTKLIFLWPLILMGYLFRPLADWGANPEMSTTNGMVTLVKCKPAPSGPEGAQDSSPGQSESASAAPGHRPP